MATAERYTRTTNAQGLQLITRRDGQALGTPRPPRDAQLEEALDLLRRAAAALRESAQRRGLVVTPRPKHGLPPELAGIDGAAVVRARGLKRVSQRDLAVLVDYSRSGLAEMERGTRSVSERVARWAHEVLRASDMSESEVPG